MWPRFLGKSECKSRSLGNVLSGSCVLLSHFLLSDFITDVCSCLAQDKQLPARFLQTPFWEFLMLIPMGRSEDIRLALRRREQREMKNKKSINVAKLLEAY